MSAPPPLCAQIYTFDEDALVGGGVEDGNDGVVASPAEDADVASAGVAERSAAARTTETHDESGISSSYFLPEGTMLPLLTLCPLLLCFLFLFLDAKLASFPSQEHRFPRDGTCFLKRFDVVVCGFRRRCYGWTFL